MRAVIQRVMNAGVTINGEVHSEINKGLLVFIGIEDAGSDEDIDWLSKKIIHLRIFDDEHKVPNISLKDLFTPITPFVFLIIEKKLFLLGDRLT